VPPGYDASTFPAFAVTVDVVILTMADGVLHVLLVRRGEEPFKGMWAIPGGFKRPEETLDEAARRELSEETGVDVPSLLTQFGAYGDPGRDPRMNVVTVAYLGLLLWRFKSLKKRRAAGVKGIVANLSHGGTLT
jgi:8-oxo-dGTP diphosphatase